MASYPGSNGFTQGIFNNPSTGTCYGLDYHPESGWYVFSGDDVYDVRDALALRRQHYEHYETIQGIDTAEDISHRTGEVGSGGDDA